MQYEIHIIRDDDYNFHVEFIQSDCVVNRVTYDNLATAMLHATHWLEQ